MKKRNKHVQVLGSLMVRTGVRIGAPGSSLEIGGLDNPILRHPVTRLPYIPGSSLKGKLRSLLETAKTLPLDPPPSPVEKYNREGKSLGHGPCECNRCIVCTLFGCGKPEISKEPTRLIFRDSQIVNQGDVDERIFGQLELKSLLKEGVFYSEVKTEVVMNREGKVAEWAGPRSMDRIAAGTLLDFRVTVRVLEGDDEEIMKEALAHALRLCEAEGLGGSVSRGYGQVKFEELTWDGQPWDIHARSSATA